LTNSKKSAQHKRIDWPAAKIEYVTNAALTLDDIAKKYGATRDAVYQRSKREAWTGARAQRSQELSERVREKTLFNAVEELTHYNEQDLLAAKALRALVAKKLQAAQQSRIEAKDLRALAVAVESAQRIARLALGAATATTETRISEIERMTPEERRERARQLHAQLFGSETVQ
jgi:hypothetical protein